MRNLCLSHVVSHTTRETDAFENCEAFDEDHAAGLLFIANKQRIIVWDKELAEAEKSIDWETERRDTFLVNLQYMFDSNELVAVLSNGVILVVNIDSDEVTEAAFTGSQCYAAAWNIDLTTLALTDGHTLLYYDRLLENTAKRSLFSSEVGKDELVTVGWGSRETQFQGSAGKAAREKKAASRVAYADDSYRPNLKWRADSLYLFVSYLHVETKERRAAVFNGDCELMSSLKNEDAMEEQLAVRPNGNYVATTRIDQTDNSRHFVFFERNGEKRHEAAMTCADGLQIAGMDWDMEGTVLAVHLKTAHGWDRVELWTVSNYDWTRKYALKVPGGVAAWKWSAEKARTLSIVSQSGTFVEMLLDFEYCAPSGIAVVVATDKLRVTNLSRLTIPPPMYEYSIDVPDLIVSCLYFDAYRLVVMDIDWNLHIYETSSDSGRLSFVRTVETEKDAKWIVCSALSCDPTGETFLAVANGNELIMLNNANGRWEKVESPTNNAPIVWTGVGSRDDFQLATSQGTFHSGPNWSSMFTLPEATSYEVKPTEDSRLAVLSSSNELFVNGVRVADGVTSFLVKEDVLLYITLDHKLHMVDMGSEGFKQIDNARSVELSSRLVCCAIDGGTSLTMQMARGSLETIHPRPFIVRVLRRLIDDRKYVDALRMMKKHRINMNLLVDHKPEEFVSNVVLLFTDESDADLINLLVASLSEETSEWTQGQGMLDKVTRVTSLLCSSVLSLPMPSRLSFFTVLLSSLLKQKPARVEEALKYIKEHTDQVSQSDRDTYSRNWLHHVNFFVDEKSIFNAALATYDLRLTVQVAEATNRDPKEYLPLLNELRQVEPAEYRAYRIDLVREDWIGALAHLAKLDDKFEEACELIETRKLYSHALRIYTGGSKYEEICSLVAAHSEKKGEWKEAAMLYEKAGEWQKVFHCHEMSRDASAYLEVVSRLNEKDVLILDDTVRATLLKMSLQLQSNGKWAESAEVMRKMNGSCLDVVTAYCKGNAWTEAVAALRRGGGRLPAGPEWQFVREASIEKANKLLEDIASRQHTIAQHAKRLEVVREIKEKRILNMKEGIETGRDIEDCDAFSDAASTLSMLSRRTGKSGSSRASTTATVRKRKQIDRKKQSLKEGGEYEDSALLLALHQQYTWIQDMIVELRSLLPCLLHFDEYELAGRLQVAAGQLVDNSQSKRTAIWPAKLQPKHLCGPLHVIYSIDDVFSFPEDGGMPNVVVIEPEMMPPAPLSTVNWKMKILED